MPIFQVFSDDPSSSRSKPISDHMRSVMDDLVSVLVLSIDLTDNDTYTFSRDSPIKLSEVARCSRGRKRFSLSPGLAHGWCKWAAKNGQRWLDKRKLDYTPCSERGLCIDYSSGQFKKSCTIANDSDAYGAHAPADDAKGINSRARKWAKGD